MTTGLLEKLKNKNYDLKNWILEDLVRQFGLCYSLRDDDYNLTKNQILKKLQKRDEESRISINKEINPLLPKEPSIKEMKKSFSNYIESNKKRLEEAKEQKIKVDSVVNELNKMNYNYNGNDELVINLFGMARKQLAILKDDIEWDIKYSTENLSKYKTFDEYVTKQKEQYIYSLQRIEEEKTKALNKKPLDYAEQYKKLIDLIEGL